MMRKIVACILVLMMILSLTPTAFAAISSVTVDQSVKTVTQGDPAVFIVTVTNDNTGLANGTTFSINGNLTGSFNPDQVELKRNDAAQTELTILTGDLAPGTYTFTVTATAPPVTEGRNNLRQSGSAETSGPITLVIKETGTGDPEPVDPVAVNVEASDVQEGDLLSASELTGSFKDPISEAAVPGTLAWTDGNLIVNATGNFEWTFTPDDLAVYNQITGTVEVIATPVVIVPDPVDPVLVNVEATEIQEGDLLSASELTGSFNDPISETAVPGTLAWTDGNLIVEETGNFEWTFIPDDLSVYNQITGPVEVIATPVVIVPDPVDPVLVSVEATGVQEGDLLSASELTGSFKDPISEAAVPGTLAWTDGNLIVNATGNFEWTFTPDDLAVYNQINGTVVVIATPVVIVPPPTSISYVALGDSLVTGTTGISGTMISYVHGFRSFLETQYNVDVLLTSLAADGDASGHLLAKLGQSDFAATVAAADVITLAIGGNNVMPAARESGFWSIDHAMAEAGTSAFENEYSQIINRIRELNPNADLIVMTLYNPYNSANQPTRYSGDTVLHAEAAAYISRINQQIFAHAGSGNYSIADVHAAFLSFAAQGKMGDITYFYPAYSWWTWFIVRNTRDPHPNQAGQNLMRSLHESLFNEFSSRQTEYPVAA